MKQNTFKFISLLLIIIIVIGSFASCGQNSNENGSVDNGGSLSEPTKKSLDQRKKIAEKAVAKYINNYMRNCADSGAYSVIDYDEMRYTASSSANGNVFTVKIDIYHYNSYGELVGKNKLTIKASAKVDEYGNVSDVKALDFLPVEWK